MLDIGFLEVGLIAVVLLLVLGPKRLPVVAKVLGVWLTKTRRFWEGVKQEANQVVDEESPNKTNEKDR